MPVFGECILYLQFLCISKTNYFAIIQNLLPNYKTNKDLRTFSITEILHGHTVFSIYIVFLETGQCRASNEDHFVRANGECSRKGSNFVSSVDIRNRLAASIDGLASAWPFPYALDRDRTCRSSEERASVKRNPIPLQINLGKMDFRAQSSRVEPCFAGFRRRKKNGSIWNGHHHGYRTPSFPKRCVETNLFCRRKNSYIERFF